MTGLVERPARVLVVDDEPQMQRALRSVLAAAGYEPEIAGSGEAALAATAERTPDAIVLDLTLPGMDGLEACRELREWFRGPVLVLSVRDSDDDKISALDLGADDYLTKPFSTGELLARLRALLRRTAGADSSVGEISAGDVTIDFAARRVTVRGEQVHLTPLEYGILSLLARNAGRVVTSGAILSAVWGPEYVGDTQTLRAHVSHLRKKIERPGDVPRHVLTEPGVGFRFVAPAE